MKITQLKTNHLVNPIGFDLEHVVFTWAVEDTNDKHMVDGLLQVALDLDFNHIIYEVKGVEALDNRGTELPNNLNPYTRYYWRVEVVGDGGDQAWSETQFFETGKMQESWQAEWITTTWEDQTISPYMRKEFGLDETKKVTKARAYIIGLGVYEFAINGERVGSEILTPYCNAYDAWLQYQTYDVTEHIKAGGNAIGVTLGNGWAKGKFGTFGDMNSPYIHEFALLCEIHIEYADASKEVIISDPSWTCHASAIVEDSIYDGEVYDATKEVGAWTESGYEGEGWTLVKAYDPKGLGPVVDRMSPPVIVKETIEPIELIHTPAGEWVLDMGQNMVGWIRFTVDVPKGSKVKLSFGEILQENNFYRDNLREAKARYEYISDGQKRSVEPHFTYYGFRYVKLEGFGEDIQLEDFTGCVIYSDLDTIGHIETSDPMVNRLFLNALWGQKGNFLDVPTDCPQRDERMGWTGDAQIFSGTASFNMDTYAFYVKFMRDLYEEQKFAGGMVASTVPTFSQNKTTESSFIAGGACAWGDAATVIPWEVYLHTGDATILKRQYQSMKDWVDWVIRKDVAQGDRKLWTEGFQFGDWLALDGPVEGGVMGGTDKGLLASAYYFYSTEIMAKTAQVLGNSDDAKYYGQHAKLIKKAIQDEYFSKSGRSTVDTQTARIVALQFNLLEDSMKAQALKDLIGLLKKSNMHLKTGFIGTPYLCRALSDMGASDEAYQVFFQEDYPSWLYEVKMGATTIWERWNSVLPNGKISGTDMNSLNHYAYGSIIEWVYRNVCGIKPVEDQPGFKAFIIKPEVYGKLKYANASLSSPMGKIETGWEVIAEKTVKLHVKVPFNVSAKVILQDTRVEAVKIDISSVIMVQVENDVEVTLKSGFYEFEYETNQSILLHYDLSTPLYLINQDESAKEILRKYGPHLVDATPESLGGIPPYSIQEVLESGEGFLIHMTLRGMDVEAYTKEIGKLMPKVR